ncbi:hypothetical protein CPHO_02310 [Corynebacterium phocae]|uniref:Surface-anchored protein n=1 Tax=Corynebacterium phocae TaxID=161895 RepID=A0A1L7D1F8_9CORY|nr:choice-of-anchor M domain-containing protein [Corynebacterium phocae]APT91934.1 hypothetical protein CPHO_02310 [Corynebacterium phocae]KAA8726918.1 hypothetical protein F4V58_01845 [Corynebacterium phocae]
MTQHRRALHVLSAVTAFSLAITPTVALAGPDDGKLVVTEHHIDSPKTFRLDDGTYKLQTEYANHQIAQLDESVIYIGKGWSNKWKQQYQLTIPEDDTFDYAHLVQGGTYYAAPVNPWGNRNPVWWGFGADESVKMEPFQDGKFFLDLVEANGPGRVEMFGYYEGSYPLGLSKILGSGENSQHSSQLKFAEHTHNYTLFTQPGRYELKYRVSGRSKDDKSLIHSEVQTLVVQVGGQKPKDEATAPLMERYNAAPAGDAATAGYSFGFAPLTSTRGWDGDAHLDTFTFDAKDPNVNGTLTLLNNGYHLTDLEVKDGKAEWHEMVGPESSDIQAVFIPADEKGSKWITPVLTRKVDDDHKGIAQSVTSDQSAETIAPEKADPRNSKQSLESYEPAKDIDFTTTITPIDEDNFKASFDFSDPKFRGLVTLESEDEITKYSHFVEGGHGELILDSYELNGKSVSVQAFPHSTIEVESSTKTTPQPVNGETTLPTAVLKRYAAAEPPKNTPEPKKAQFCEDRILLDHGHTDLKVRRDGASLKMAISDETGTESEDFYDRKVSEVLNVAVPGSRQVYSNRHEGLDFLDPKYLEDGKHFYLLPETNSASLLWPGYNTQALNMDAFEGGVRWHVEPVALPDGAQFGLFQNSTLSNPKPEVLVDTVNKDYEVDIEHSTHVHMNWAFSKPGAYKFKTYFEATTTDGKTVTTEPEVLAFVAGQPAGTECDAFKAAKDTPAPETTVPETTTPQPSTPETTTPQPSTPETTVPETTVPNKPGQDSNDFLWRRTIVPIVGTVATLILTLLGIGGLHSVLDIVRRVIPNMLNR